MDNELFVVLWTDDDGPQAALYDDWELADRDAELVGGRVEPRAVHRAEHQRTGRFARNDG